MDAINLRRPVDLALLALGCALVFGVLFPVSLSGFHCDDVHFSSIAGKALENGQSFLRLVIDDSHAWIKLQARPFPIGLALGYAALFYGGVDPFVPKLIHVLLAVGAVASVAVFAANLSGSHAIGILFLAISPLALQVRYASEPLTCYIPLIPALTILIVGQAALLDAYLRKGGMWRLALSIVLFAVSLLTYELALIGPLLNAVVVLRHRLALRRVFFLALPYAVILVGYLGTVAALRATVVNTRNPYDGIAVSWMNFPRGLFIHLVGALPFSYRVVDPEGLFATAATSWPLLGGALGATALALWFAAWRLMPARLSLRWSVALGAILLLAPAALVATSKTHQNVLLGQVHTSAFLSSLGCALLIACVLARIRAWPMTVALGLLLVATPFLLLRWNQTTLDAFDRKFAASERRNFVRAAQNGLLDHVPNGGAICADQARLPWLSGHLTLMLTKRPIAVMGSSDCPASAYRLEFRREEVKLVLGH